MFFRKDKMNNLNDSIKKINNILEKGNIEELIYVLGNKKEIIIRNFFAGLFRGIGIGIGVTVVTSIVIIILKKIVTLNIPLIGKYIAEIIEIVESSK